MNLHPHLTRTQYQALRRTYRLAVREDALEASLMPRLASQWRRRATHSRTAAIAARLDPWLVDTFRRTPSAPMQSARLVGRMGHYFRGKRIEAALSDARAAIASYEASRTAA